MKTYKWGIIGTGFITQKMADAFLFLPNVKIAAGVSCLEQGLTQSKWWSWDDSLLIIDTLDEIRRQIGLVFDGHDR